ncbi:ROTUNDIFOLIA like 7 [Striga asiatica]|uniref:ROTUNDIFOLIA like 7 n=1 Tax=Striga asiatica TaxID=4170 RepID=A0A5A7QI34_STRAF|nr:ROTUNDIFOLIA like 7 [Striga asiatica]
MEFTWRQTADSAYFIFFLKQEGPPFASWQQNPTNQSLPPVQPPQTLHFLYPETNYHRSMIRVRKFCSWRKCSRFVQEQRTRFYIIWRCSIILIRWKFEGVRLELSRG